MRLSKLAFFKFGSPFVFVLACLLSTAQTVQTIDSMMRVIDKIEPTQIVSITDSAELRNKDIKKIVGYMLGDSLLKSVVWFKNEDRVRTTYYTSIFNNLQTVMYVKDAAEKDTSAYSEIFVLDFKTFESRILKPSKEDEKVHPGLLAERGDYSTPISFKQVDLRAKKYEFTGQLVELVPLPPSCGFLAWGVAYKFEVLQTNFKEYNSKYVLAIQTCPEFVKDSFYKKKKTYKLILSTNSGVSFSFVVQNKYEKEDIPIFWIEKITKPAF